MLTEADELVLSESKNSLSAAGVERFRFCLSDLNSVQVSRPRTEITDHGIVLSSNFDIVKLSLA